MKLLVSPMNTKEAVEAIAGGADVIDVKNPTEGALGANFPWVIKKIRAITPRNIALSCTIGDVPDLPGSMSLAALGAASLGVDYIKVGLYGFKTPKDAICLLSNVNKAAKECNSKIKVVASGYADAERISSLDPMLIPKVASKAQVDLAMLDTSVKDGKSIFDFLSPEQLACFVNSSHRLGLEASLAGSLRKQDLPLLCSLGVDIAGVRGAACTNSDRMKGHVTRALVAELINVIKKAELSRV